MATSSLAPQALCRQGHATSPWSPLPPRLCILPVRPSHRPRQQLLGGRRHTMCRANDGNGAPGGGEFEKGVEEAEEILEEATILAEEQTRRELADSLQGLSGVPGVDDGSAAERLSPEDWEALVSFWEQEGLSPRAAESLSRDLEQWGGPYRRAEACEGRLNRLRAILPDVNVAGMCTREPSLLVQEPAAVTGRLLEASGALGGAGGVACPSALELVEGCPAILSTSDGPERLTTALRKIQEWQPSGTIGDAVTVVIENPNLLMRVPIYYEDCEFFELPLDVQNMFEARPHYP